MVNIVHLLIDIDKDSDIGIEMYILLPLPDIAIDWVPGFIARGCSFVTDKEHYRSMKQETILTITVIVHTSIVSKLPT